MRSVPTVRRHRGSGRTGPLGLRATAAAAMLLGTMTVGLVAAGAQADEDAGTDDSPTFGYTLEWDADQGTVEQEAEAADNAGRDFVALRDVDDRTSPFAEGVDGDTQIGAL